MRRLIGINNIMNDNSGKAALTLLMPKRLRMPLASVYAVKGSATNHSVFVNFSISLRATFRYGPIRRRLIEKIFPPSTSYWKFFIQ